MHAWRLLRAALITGIVGASLAVPATASAEDPPPSSAVEVSATTLAPGDTFTVTQTVHNQLAGPLLGGKAALYAQNQNITDWLELVGCTGAVVCFVAEGTHLRAAFGDVPAGESRTVVWTMRVKDATRQDPFVLRHQFLADNYAFDVHTGPTITITPSAADIAVSLTASVRSAITARITYTITVKNNGPADATAIRVVGTYPAGLAYAGSNCTRVGTTRSVNCDIASLASGASTTRTVSADTGLLTAGALTGTATRTASSPSDPVATNDKASRTCNALTGLIVTC
ncbi:DUF11 domain-containing protein [Kribbella sp. HUAS MG21]|uniref:DUF11 domain-containing protein n=1 Tax=Kribbella sp. HUAS MG21 TaxID=3160966 RepID=A0AAU7TGV2_9ACTN